VYVQSLVSCGRLNTSASVVETDEGLSTDDQSLLTGSCSHPHCFHSDIDHSAQLHILSLHQELLRKNEQLKFLRQTLKDVCMLCVCHTLSQQANQLSV